MGVLGAVGFTSDVNMAIGFCRKAIFGRGRLETVVESTGFLRKGCIRVVFGIERVVDVGMKRDEVGSGVGKGVRYLVLH